MRIVLPIATAYLVYLVIGSVIAYVLLSHVLRLDERTAMADLDREFRELVHPSRSTRVRRDSSSNETRRPAAGQRPIA